jgi:hypothetical protein
VYEKKNKKLTNKQKNRATCFFFLSHHTDFVRLHSHTYKETHQKRRKKREDGWLPSTANKQEKKKDDEERKKRNEDRPYGDNNNNGSQGQKRKRATVMHTHTHSASKWHSRRSEKTKKERETDKKRHTRERETWWLNNEQKIHTNSLIQVRRSRETRWRKKNWEKAREKQTNK